MKQLKITITIDINEADENKFVSCKDMDKNLKDLFTKKNIFEPYIVTDVKTEKLNFDNNETEE